MNWTARIAIVSMRAVPACFTLGWLAVAAIWLAEGRSGRAASALAVAVIAASFGARIAIANRRCELLVRDHTTDAAERARSAGVAIGQ